MSDPSQIPQTQHPMRLMQDQLQAACDINAKHRAYLVERIAQLKAWADSRQVEAATAKDAKQDPGQMLIEAERLNAQANMLTQRVAQLFGEMYGPATGSAAPQPAPTKPPKPWHKKTFWEELGKIAGWLVYLVQDVLPIGSKIDQIGNAATRVLMMAKSVTYVADSNREHAQTQEDLPQELRALGQFADAMVCIPWHLFCDDPLANDSRNLALRYGEIVRLIGAQRMPPAVSEIEISLSEFAAALPKDHAGQQALTSAGGLLDQKRYRDAAAVLLGISPPDPLRFDQALIAKNLSELALQE
jgi:hypothetical protein